MVRWLLFAGLATSCFDRGSRWVDPPPSTPQNACDLGLERCFGTALQACVSGPSGTTWSTKKDCGPDGLICSKALLACSVCEPNVTSCQGLEVVHCRPDGGGTDPMRACDPAMGEACREGGCVNLCLAAKAQRSNEGCEYWGVDLDNAMINPTSNAAAQQFAIVVSNAQPDVAADVKVFQDDSLPGEANAPYEIASAHIAPLNLQVFKLGPREVDGSPDGEFNTGTNTALTRHAYKVVSTFPVVAFQFNPLDNVNVFSNDASLLKPREALTYDGTFATSYVVTSWPQTIAATDDPNTNFDPLNPINLRAFLTLVGTQPKTHVRIHTRAGIVAGGPVAKTGIGGVVDATLDPFDVLNLETGDFNADFTGSIIEADGPVAVFTGSEASDAPHFDKLADRRCCADHLENQLDPIRTAGKKYVIAHSPSRTRAVKAAGAVLGVVPEPDYVRMVAVSSKGARITTSLPAPDDVILLGAQGDFYEVTAYTDFTVESDQPIHVAQVMASQDACGVKRGLPGGDPSLLIEPPVEQFRSSYVFLTPDKYSFDFVEIIAPRDASVLFDDTPVTELGCEKVPGDGLTDEQRKMMPPEYVVYRCQLSFPIIDPNAVAPDNLKPGVQNDGIHRIVASQPVGAVAYGIDSFVSYAYAAGTQLTEINSPE